MEKAMLRDVQHIFTLTPSDAQALTDLGYSGPIDVAPMIVPPTTQQQIAASDAFDYDVGVLGNWTWSANASGLDWFLRKVRPLLSRKMSIAIGGRGADAVAPEVTTVTRIGYVEDARIFLARCRVVAIPLQAGTGISMKVLEAACAGWPTVTTLIGARGILELPVNVVVSDLPQDFAAALTRAASIPSAQREQWMEPAARWMHDRRAAFANALKSGIDHVAP
jgi:glycosyltransferase involved in cell wall biosynthesis